MNDQLIIGFLNNGILLLSMSVLYAVLPIDKSKSRRQYELLIGTLLALVVIGIMISTIPIDESRGIFIDTRTILISVSTFFFGPLPGIMVTTASVLYRLGLGGDGLLVGMLSAIAAFGIGYLFRRLYYQRYRNDPFRRVVVLYVLGLFTHVAMVLIFFLLPEAVRMEVIRGSVLYVMVLFPLIGVAYGVLIFRRDDTVQKDQNEQAYHRQFMRAMEDSPIPVMIHEEDGKVLLFSHSWMKRTGYTKEDLKTLDTWIDRAYPTLDKAKVKRDILSIHKQEAPVYEGEYPVVSQSGETLIWDFYSTKIGPFRDNKSAVLSMANDVTKRNELERRLHTQKELAEATLLAIGDAVISTDEKGIITAINPMALSLTGYAKEEALGQPFDAIFKIVEESSETPLLSPVARVLKEKATVALENHTVLVSKEGKRYVIEDSAAPILDHEQNLEGVVLVFRDVTQKRKEQREIEYLSLHDHLTGLFNRRHLAEELSRLDTQEFYPLGVMMIDLNGLKILNDAYGHDTGDEALKRIADILKEKTDEKGVVARIGGDEFTIVLPNTSSAALESLKTDIYTTIDQTKVNNVTLSLSIGHAIKTDAPLPIADLLKTAEDRMYKQKLIMGVSARNHTIQAILKTLTDKYEDERVHSERVGKISRAIGKALGLNDEQLKELELSGMFHDIGKIAIPDAILEKPSKLTEEEYTLIKTHTENGYQILRAADEYSSFAEHALLHHERYDGKGYPRGLAKKAIPLFARIVSVADAYEAMTSDRPYRKALPLNEAIEELKKNRGTQFDPDVVDAFFKVYNQKQGQL
ncbi:MAG: HD domain-containing phosphohydrolase [Bacillota bacterium]